MFVCSFDCLCIKMKRRFFFVCFLVVSVFPCCSLFSLIQPRSQGLSSSRQLLAGRRRDPGNEVVLFPCFHSLLFSCFSPCCFLSKLNDYTLTATISRTAITQHLHNIPLLCKMPRKKRYTNNRCAQYFAKRYLLNEC